MSSTAIRVEGLGKRYRIGVQPQRYKAFRDTLASAARFPAKVAASLFARNRASKEAGFFWALNDVNFTIEHGEIVGILGRNGAGKSTLLKVLSRITEPTTGRATVFGRVGSLLEVGSGFHPELSGRENVYMNGAILGMKRAEIAAKFDEIVSFAEVEKFVDTPVKHYSSGMYLRLAFAVAAHLETEVLFVDEVLAVGDAGFQKKCLGKMGDVARSGRTILFVSHNLVAVENLCTQCILLEQGAVVSQGETRQVINHYVARSSTLDAARQLQKVGSDRPFRFTSIEVRSLEQQTTGAVRAGEGFILRLYFDCRERISNPVFAISIHTRLNVALFGVFSTDLGWSIPYLDAPGWVDFRIESPNLMPDTYLLHIAAGDSFNVHRYAYVTDAAVIDVIPADVYGSGRLAGASWSHVFFQCQMNVSESVMQNLDGSVSDLSGAVAIAD